MSREKRLARGGHGPKMPPTGTFLTQTSHSPSRACRRRPCGSTPTAKPCGSSAHCVCISLREGVGRHARCFRPYGTIAPHYRAWQSASSPPTRSSLRSRCAPGHLPDPLAWAAGPPAAAFGEYPASADILYPEPLGLCLPAFSFYQPPWKVKGFQCFDTAYVSKHSLCSPLTSLHRVCICSDIGSSLLPKNQRSRERG